MKMKTLLQRISIDQNICFGKPCIRGTRIWVSLLLDLLADGMTMEEIMIEYPHLTREDIRAAVAYGAEMSRESKSCYAGEADWPFVTWAIQDVHPEQTVDC
jgi:uncharacterized protein (DUF433 family)